ncbi:MAG: hypothetical protein QW086_01115 [Pyrobaculum sp.]
MIDGVRFVLADIMRNDYDELVREFLISVGSSLSSLSVSSALRPSPRIELGR